MPLYMGNQPVGEMRLDGQLVAEGWMFDGAGWVQVYSGGQLDSMRMVRTDTQYLDDRTNYHKITDMQPVTTAPYAHTVVIDSELEAQRKDGRWRLDAEVVLPNGTYNAGVRVMRRRGATTVALQTFTARSATVSGTLTATVQRGDRVWIEAMHSQLLSPNILSGSLTATAI